MYNIGTKLVCKHGNKIDDFAIFAEVISCNDNKVTLLRANKFGSLLLSDLVLSISNVSSYYSVLDENEASKYSNVFIRMQKELSKYKSKKIIFQ